MPIRPVIASRVTSDSFANAVESKLRPATLPITHAIVIFVDSVANAIPTGRSVRESAATRRGIPAERNPPFRNPNAEPLVRHTKLRYNLTRDWYSNWLGLLQALSIPVTNTKILTSSEQKFVFTPKEKKEATWENISAELSQLCASAKNEGGTVLVVYCGCHAQDSNTLLIPVDDKSDTSHFGCEDLQNLLASYLPDRGALVIIDSFDETNGRPIQEFPLRPLDQVCVPHKDATWTLKVVESTPEQEQRPLFNPPDVTSHLLSKPYSHGAPGSLFQISSDHYLLPFQTISSNTDSITTASGYKSEQLKQATEPVLFASLFLLSISQDLTKPEDAKSDLLGFLMVLRDEMGFTEEAWNLKKMRMFPDRFHAHCVIPTGEMLQPEWHLIDYLAGIPELVEDTTETVDGASVKFRTIRLAKLRDFLGSDTIKKLIWSGFRQTSQTPPNPESWYQFKDSETKVYCAGTGDRPNFASVSWWSASGAPLKGPKLTFSRLAKDAILPALTFTSIELP